MPGIVTSGEARKINSMVDKTVRLTIDLQELDPEQLSRLFGFLNSYVKIYITNENISTDEIEIIDAEELDHESKSPSQRLRNVLYRYYEQDNRGYQDFNLYYSFMMRQITEHYKSKLI